MGEHAAWAGSGARSVLGDLETIFAEQARTICEAPAGAHHLDDDEIRAAREDVARWRAGEQKVLDELFPED